MAKLEGVKTLDMVNGEITKVSYGGADYEIVEGEAKVGDIALAIKSAEDTTLGNFYPVTDTSHGDIMYMDDVDDEQVNPPECFRIFRKVAASTNPSVEERVAKAEGEIESLKSDVAALKGEAEYKRIGKSEAQVGDYVKFIETNDSSITVGKMYGIVNIDYEGYLDFIDDDGDKNCGVSSEVFEVYRKVSAAIVEAEPKPERLKVGDYAKVVGQSIINEKGDIVKIIQDTGGNVPFKVESVNGLYKEWRSEESLVRATDEEVDEAKRAAAEAAERKKWAQIGREVGEYKGGDIVRVIDSGSSMLHKGDIGPISEIDGSCVKVAARNLTGVTWLNFERIELVTPVEARFDR